MFLKKSKYSKTEIQKFCQEIKDIYLKQRLGISKEDEKDSAKKDSLTKECDSKDVMHSEQVDSRSKVLYSGKLDEEIVLQSSFSVQIQNLLKFTKLSERAFYKRSGIGRKIFWNIINIPTYQPSKETAVACALGLHLTLNETENLLKIAGYALSDSIMFDVAIKYCIEHEIYEIMAVNEILVGVGREKVLRTE